MEIHAQKRELTKKKVKKIRDQGLLPAVISGKDLGSIPLTLNKKEFEKLYREAGESTLVDVIIEGEKPQKALITEVAVDPVTDEIIHANFHAVTLTEKVTAMVPIKIVGESPVVKGGEGILLTVLDELEVEALPQDLPSKIPVDVSQLDEIGKGITVEDLKIDRSKIKILNDPEDLIVKVDYPQREEEEETPPEEVEPTSEEEKEEETPKEEAESATEQS